MRRGSLASLFAFALGVAAFTAPAHAADDKKAEGSVAEKAEKAPKKKKRKRANVNPNQPGGLAAVGSHDGPQPFPLHFSASLTHAVGGGSLLLDPGGNGLSQANNPNVASTLNLRPTAVLPGNWVFVLSQTFTQEWTQQDIGVTSYDFFDTAFSARWNGIRPKGTNFIGGLNGGLRFPTSKLSRGQGQLLGLTLGASGLYRVPSIGMLFFAGITPGLNLSSASFAAANAASETGGEVVDSHGQSIKLAPSCILRSPDEVESFACGRTPPLFRMVGSLGGTWSGFEGKVAISAGLSVLSLWNSYEQKDDEFTPQPRDENGNPVSVRTGGLSGNQLTFGSLTATWFPLPWLSVSAGTSSFQPMFAANGTTLRFPFWDFVTPRNNFSTFTFDTTVSF